MIGCYDMIPLSLKPLPSLACNAKFGVDNCCGGNTPQTDDDFRLNQHELISEIIQTCLLFIIMGVTVAGRTTLDHIGNIGIL